MNPEFIINIFILEVHIIFQVYVIIINVFNCILDTNIYEYADMLECEYTDVHKYEYANIYEYELVETQKMKRISTGTKVLHLRRLRGRHFSKVHL